ncbi:MAG: 16S rRNA (cytidine(1402)-2'-O)-methyltransferase [Candidatus Melainabacteria bacterium]|nr:16S rRNA (cytidine(1402)-2'-O)-methyltransferase [Candidatus Melainabacteria bacterium]
MTDRRAGEVANWRIDELMNCPIVHSPILYIVATPIGNLEDITLRALRILKEVDYILCEDKRITVRLLNKYEIKSKLISLHKYNEEKSTQEILSLLKEGKNIALVSDAGTPLISDPGSRLITHLRKNNIKIISIPGPSSLTSALSACGFDLREVLFLGFLPAKKSKREKIISSLKERAKVVVIFVAPHDLKKYLLEIYNIYPDIKIFYSREISKIYEENWSGNIKDLVLQLEAKPLKGEIVLILNFNFICD